MATKGFIFNLLPGKSKKEVKKEDDRDSSSFYIVLVLLIVTVLWVISSLSNSVLVNNYIGSWNTRITDQEAEILGYAATKATNGELVTKTKALENVIDKNIDPDEFFSLVEGTITSASPSAIIRSYGREESGTFNVNGEGQSFQEVSKIIYVFTSNQSFTDVKLQNVVNDFEKGAVTFSLAFQFIGQTEEN